MKIALIGYGKMGKAIADVARERGHEICIIISGINKKDLTEENLRQCDIAIEFTNPESAFNNITTCINAGIPVISGSTGWLDRRSEVDILCADKNGSFLYASNFSVGVNLFFELNKKLASLMAGREEYNVEIREIHHTQKKDAPSGTAITLAEQVLERSSVKRSWVNNENGESDQLSIISERIDPAPGTHHVQYISEVDDIEIIHTAHSRYGFARGAVMAAEFLVNRKGVFSMKDVLGL